MRIKSWIKARQEVLAVTVVACAVATAQAPTSLKDAYKGDFVVGAAMNSAQITGQDQRGDALIESQFNSISPEDVLKWEIVHPQPDKYDFDLADKYVAFGAGVPHVHRGPRSYLAQPDSGLGVPRRQGQSAQPRRAARRG